MKAMNVQMPSAVLAKVATCRSGRMQMSNDDFDMSMPTKRLIWGTRLVSLIREREALSTVRRSLEMRKGFCFFTNESSGPQRTNRFAHRHKGVAITQMTNEAGSS